MMNVLSQQRLINLPSSANSRDRECPSPEVLDAVETTTHKWVEVPIQALSSSARLLSAAEYSDVALTYGGDLFRAHRAIIWLVVISSTPFPLTPVFASRIHAKLPRSLRLAKEAH
ncbi:MAG: hypothetical protein Q9162_006596 [Coniocarpon cinnabarinum]